MVQARNRLVNVLVVLTIAQEVPPIWWMEIQDAIVHAICNVTVPGCLMIPVQPVNVQVVAVANIAITRIANVVGRFINVLIQRAASLIRTLKSVLIFKLILNTLSREREERWKLLACVLLSC